MQRARWLSMRCARARSSSLSSAPNPSPAAARSARQTSRTPSQSSGCAGPEAHESWGVPDAGTEGGEAAGIVTSNIGHSSDPENPLDKEPCLRQRLVQWLHLRDEIST